MRKWFLRLVVWSALITTLVIGPATSASASQNDLSAVRKATAKFHSVARAEAAGYSKAPLPCFDNPGVGGMGLHWVKGPLNGKLTPTAPSAMVYEVDGNELNLVGVEYIVPYTVVPTTSQPPQLFGHWFFHNDSLQLWALHAWIWRENPLGTFATWNPKVELCPGHGED